MEEKTNKNKEKNVGMAVVAYIVFFVPLLSEAKDDPFVKFHTHQGFVLFVGAVAINIIPFIMPFLFPVTILGQFGIIILAIIGIMNALNGKKEPLPIIGHLAEKVSF
jgi:uncharacterized membrane protein